MKSFFVSVLSSSDINSVSVATSLMIVEYMINIKIFMGGHYVY